MIKYLKYCIGVVIITLNCKAQNVLIVTTTDDLIPGSLRESINAALPGDTIKFHPSLNGDTILLTGEIIIDKDIIIQGNKRDSTIIDGNLSGRIFNISGPAAINISSLTICNGFYPGDDQFQTEGGGAIFLYNATLTLNFVDIRASSAHNGGSMTSINSDLVLSNCSFRGNMANNTGGGIVMAGDPIQGNTAVITNSVFSGNVSLEGGGFSMIDMNITLINCTVAGNYAFDVGGGIYIFNDQGNLELKNCIIFNNNADVSSNEIDGSFIATFSLIKNENPGGTNFDGNVVDPLFIQSITPNGSPFISGNYRLQATSPLIDMGNNSDNNSEFEIDGVSRIIDGDNDSLQVIDIGAYELCDQQVFNATRSVCDEFFFGTDTIFTSGNYSKTFQKSNRCDSIVFLDLTILESSGSNLNETTCDFFVFLGDTLATTGVYQRNITNSVGCDSLITLNLTLLESTSSTLDTSACDNYLFFESNLTSSGVYQETITNSQGCDSLITLNLDILISTFNNLEVSACENYDFYGNNLNNSGFYQHILTNSSGCDSLVNLSLTITNISCLRIPKLVTPNGDGINDFWDIENLNEYNGNQVKLYNRWGIKVFETKNYGSGNHFNGISNVNSKQLPEGTYYYVIDIGHYSKPLSGFIILER